MTDLANDIAAEAVVEDDAKYFIEVTLKNGAGTIVYDTRQITNDDVYREALMLGLKAMSEKAMSKITKEAYPDEAERKAAILAKAQANQAEVYAGTIKLSGKKSVKKASGAVMTEAMRLARNLVKDAMKANKIKISHVKASEITAAAKALLDADPSIVATAEANLKAREATPLKINVAALIKTDAELVAKDEAKKAKAKAEKPLSKTQAGKVAPRAKGSKPQPAAHA